MCEFVAQFGRVVLLKAKSTVEFRVKPYLRRVIVLDDNPLSDIKLSFIDDQWIFNVFLHNILSLLS
jgi:hypothetical protein